jgi:uncharacterized protein involved in tolerance to divalent cations
MTQRKVNILDKIGSLIPGYQGYATRDNMRTSDKQIRTNVSEKLIRIEEAIEEIKKDFIIKDKIQEAKEFELIRKNINTLASKIKHAQYGETAFFSLNQIKEDELEQIQNFDLQISERISLMQVLVETKKELSITSTALNQSLKEIDKTFQERNHFIQQFK